jgi:hypothetical protein
MSFEKQNANSGIVIVDQPFSVDETEQPGLSMAALAELNQTSLDSNLLALQSAGRIRHLGPSRCGYWEVLDQPETDRTTP